MDFCWAAGAKRSNSTKKKKEGEEGPPGLLSALDCQRPNVNSETGVKRFSSDCTT